MQLEPTSATTRATSQRSAPRGTRLLALLLTGVLLAVSAAGCGGEQEDVGTLLEQTFSGDRRIDSGRLSLEATLDVGGSDRVRGPMTFALSGPFARRSPDELPEFQLTGALSGAGVTYEAGATSAGGRGYVRFGSEDYVLSRQLFAQFRSGFERARRARTQRRDGGSGADPATLGMDPRRWLTHAETAGTARVGDVETIRITGEVDVPKLLDDLARAGERARRLDPKARRGSPGRLSRRRLERIEQAVERMRVELFTGAADRTLRRIVLHAELKAPPGAKELDSAQLRLDYSITELNEDQEIVAPRDPEPFERLARQLRGLGIAGLGAGRREGEAPRPSRRELRRYTRCVERAGDDDAAVARCADLL